MIVELDHIGIGANVSVAFFHPKSTGGILTELVPARRRT